jgi:SAM-dependent methyltransferase
MPDLRENIDQWDANYSWPGRGDEWSGPWGGTEAMWWGVLRPRVRAWVPTGTILEIAPGFGRWTQFLKDLCEELVVVDIAERCIEACRQRFSGATNIAYHVNDGRSLDMVPPRSIDFTFSFDSLVHSETEVLTAYLEQLASKLKPDGIGFFHHSNMGAHRRSAALAARVPDRLRRRLVLWGLLPNVYAWRAQSVSAEWFGRQCEEVGLRCIAQEVINWEYSRQTIDCISVFTPAGSAWSRELMRVENSRFMAEAASVRRLRALYAP